MNLITRLMTGCGLFFSSMLIRSGNDGQLSLYDGQWKLEKIHSVEKIVSADEKSFIHFDKAKQSAAGNGGCNVFGSTIVVNSQSIRFKDIFSTKMYCEGVQAREDLFFQLLGRTNRYEIKG